MVWWKFWFRSGKRDHDYEVEALQSGWVPPTELASVAPAQGAASQSADDTAVFLDRVYINQDC